MGTKLERIAGLYVSADSRLYVSADSKDFLHETSKKFPKNPDTKNFRKIPINT